MRLFRLFQPVREFEDIVWNFERLGGALQGGTGTATWAGGVRTSAGLLVPHGFTRPPSVVQVSSADSANIYFAVTALDFTNITVTGNTLDGSLPAAATTHSFYWLAIG